MAGEALIKGETGIIYVWDAAATIPAYRPVACLTESSLSSTLSVIESNTKCNPGTTVRIPDKRSYELSLDGEYYDTTSAGADTSKASHDFIFNLQKGTGIVDWKLDTGLADTTYYGNAVITDMVLTQPSTGVSTFSATFVINGDIVTADPKA